MPYKVFLIALSFVPIFFPSIVSAAPKENSPQNPESKPELKTKATNNSFTSFRPPNKSQPQHTVGGATRGNNCAVDQNSKSKITALVPEKKQSLTLQSHPTFFAHIASLDEDKSATFVVKDKTEDYYYSQQLNLPASGGIVKMTLAENAPPLTVGQDYTWFLRVQCNADAQPEDPLISAKITRVQEALPEISQNNFSSNSQAWYDSLDNAFELSQSGDNLYWSQLLTEINMGRFIGQ